LILFSVTRNADAVFPRKHYKPRSGASIAPIM
jgi:chorismate mutase